jgi:hypothetical protein
MIFKTIDYRRAVLFVLLCGMVAASAKILYRVIVWEGDWSAGLGVLNTNLSDKIGHTFFQLVLLVIVYGVVKFRLLSNIFSMFSRKSALGFLLVSVSVGLTIILFELILRPFSVVLNTGNPNHFNFSSGKDSKYRHDDVLGYIPKMGAGYTYTEFGTKRNDFSANRTPGVRRLLFMGDSISDIGYTMDALKKISDGNIEFWNSGVSGYSTFQEVTYFSRYTRPIKPDRIVLEFCLNDFDGTPVIFKEDDGKTVFVTPYLGRGEYSPWLYKNSITYRLMLSAKAKLYGRSGLVDDMKGYLTNLKQLGISDRFDLQVIVYPIIKKYSDWPKRYKEQHQQILSILQELDIRHYDLKDLLEESINSHSISWAQMTNGDFFHPSMEFAKRIAVYVKKNGLLDGLRSNRNE